MVFKLDKSKFASGSFEESSKDSESFLRSTLPEKRLQMLEFLRSQVYAEPCPRLQRTIEVVFNSRS